MHRGGTVAGLVLAAVLVLGGALSPSRMIAVTAADGATLVCRPVGRNSTVTLIFTHSMYGGDVRETYAIATGERLQRTGIVTDNAASAEYYATDGRILRDGDRYRLLVPELTIDELVFRIDDTGRHRLEIDGQTMALADGSGRSRRARLHVVTGTALDALLSRFGVMSPC